MTDTQAATTTPSSPVLHPLPAALMARVVNIGRAGEAPCMIPAFELDALKSLLLEVGVGPHSDAEFTTVDWLAEETLNSAERDPDETEEEYFDLVWSLAYDDFDRMTEDDAGELACWLILRLGFTGAYDAANQWSSPGRGMCRPRDCTV